MLLFGFQPNGLLFGFHQTSAKIYMLAHILARPYFGSQRKHTLDVKMHTTSEAAPTVPSSVDGQPTDAVDVAHRVVWVSCSETARAESFGQAGV